MKAEVENVEGEGKISKLDNQIMVANTLQTLDYYRNREYKGLNFSEKK